METLLEPGTVQAVKQAVPLLLGFPMERFWVDYDKEADVLYISFRHPQKATDTQMTEDGLLFRYHGHDLVGITVLDASTRTEVPTLPAEPPAPPSPQRRQPKKKGH